MPIAVIGMGLPGAGKTTRLKPWANEICAAYICVDEIRKSLHGTTEDGHDTKIVLNIVNRRIKDALKNNRDIIVDGRFTRRSDRRGVLMACSAADIIEVIWFKASPQECLERKMYCSRQVSSNAFRRMILQLHYEPPIEEEGFHNLQIVDTSDR